MRARRSLVRAVVLTGLVVIATTPLAAADPSSPGTLVIHTVAGNGDFAYGGDGGPAIAAALYGPRRVEADGAGNIYLSHRRPGEDKGVIRKVNSAGVISTLAGAGTKKPTAQGIPVADTAFLGVMDLAMNAAGDLFVADADWRTSLLYKVSGGVIRTVVGGGTEPIADGVLATEAELDNLQAVTVAANGDIYLAVVDHVLKVDHATNKITIIAGDGTLRGWKEADEWQPATKVSITARAVAVDSTGKVYVGEEPGLSPGLVRAVDLDGKIHTVACGGDRPIEDGRNARKAKCAGHGLAVSKADKLFFVAGFGDGDNTVLALRQQSIEVVAGIPYQSGFSGDGGRAFDAKLSTPSDVAVDPAGNVYVVDEWNNRIRKISPQTPPVAKNDSATTESGKEVTGDVLANDTGVRLRVSGWHEPKNGTAKVGNDGKFSYTPKAGFTGEDSFTYTATDSAKQDSNATVKITVKAGAVTSSTPPGSGSTGTPVAQAANAKQDNGLASTGASVVGLAVTAGALLILGGGLMVLTMRRRRSRR